MPHNYTPLSTTDTPNDQDKHHGMLTQMLLRSRTNRLSYNTQEKRRLPWIMTTIVGRIIRYIIGIVSVPMVAFGLPYGPDDIVTLIMAIIGMDPFTAYKLDPTNRLLYAAAALVPVAPSTILIDPFMLLRETVEDAAYAKSIGKPINWAKLSTALITLWTIRTTNKKRTAKS